MALQEKQIFAKLRKCEFWLTKVKFLGHMISQGGVAVDPSKFGVVMDSERPTNTSKVKCFIGLMSYYWKFIKGFSHIALPMNRLTCKEIYFNWYT